MLRFKPVPGPPSHPGPGRRDWPEFPLVSRLARRLTWATFLETQVSRLGLNRFPSELACETGGKRKREGRGEEKKGEKREEKSSFTPRSAVKQWQC